MACFVLDRVLRRVNMQVPRRAYCLAVVILWGFELIWVPITVFMYEKQASECQCCPTGLIPGQSSDSAAAEQHCLATYEPKPTAFKFGIVSASTSCTSSGTCCGDLGCGSCLNLPPPPDHADASYCCCEAVSVTKSTCTGSCPTSMFTMCRSNTEPIKPPDCKVEGASLPKCSAVCQAFLAHDFATYVHVGSLNNGMGPNYVTRTGQPAVRPPPAAAAAPRAHLRGAVLARDSGRQPS